MLVGIGSLVFPIFTLNEKYLLREKIRFNYFRDVNIILLDILVFEIFE
jgi:hypothetical protein